ncbi:MAG TPA: YkgJ family cysteine cluster protein, partial [Fimbriiglobus sp.]
MKTTPHDPNGNVTVSVELPLSAGTLELELVVPAGPTRPGQMIPLFQALTNTFVEIGESQATAAGRSVSCRKGCGACCRQPVPVSEIEARHLRELVDAIPEPRRSVVLERFAVARRRAEEAGLLPLLSAPELHEPMDIQSAVTDYFRLGIACPFLEEESCSIHAVRPTSCREYLVTSPAEKCAEFKPEGIHRVPIPARVSKAIKCFDADRGERPNHWIPLILAPEWAETHPDPSEPQIGTEVFQRFHDR